MSGEINKLSCDIVRDLVPSYLENICSETSEKAVEAHLTECADCFKYVQSMREITIEGKQINLKEMDHMKKMRRYYDKKLLVHLIGILSAVFVVVWCIKGSWCVDRLWNKELMVYGSILLVTTLLLTFLLNDGQEYQEKRRVREVSAVLALLGICYTIGLARGLIYWAHTEKGPFGMSLLKTGPFLHRQIMVIVILETVLFIWSLWDAMQKDCRLGFASVAALVGIMYGMAVNETLYHMDTVDTLLALFWKMLVVFGVEGIVLGGLAVVLSRQVNKQNNIT